MPIETFNYSFESTQNMQYFDTKINCIKEREKVKAIIKLLHLRGFESVNNHTITISASRHTRILIYS